MLDMLKADTKHRISEAQAAQLTIEGVFTAKRCRMQR
jgi:hypothetical protein